MKVLLTGGSGDLGQTLVPLLLSKGHTSVILDVRAPYDSKYQGVFIKGSILDRETLKEALHAAIALSTSLPGTASTKFVVRKILTISLT
jgi:nucleoside-diphosphate-sugar epimerase